ncbi:hypothetical protein [Nonomuraea turcica]|uniref:hypothetical protein n=1 Tax=Nonomuraea sp. G32 TaxID=3067274 RepID=UPI00273C1ADB|nr:hypothetical protein [Nonomuraea sp. G32]MDP4504430.1 hypothetical protein [Nonomuraea sp. G32]
MAGYSDDLFYLVMGWCAVSVFAPHARERVNNVYRQVWLLGLGGAVVAGGFLLTSQDATPARLAHAVIVVVVAVAVSLAARKPGPASEALDDVAQAERAIGQWSGRNLYLAGTAIVLSGALLTPGQPPQRELPEYSRPTSFPREMATFIKVNKYLAPTCPWVDEIDAPCRSWLVNGRPFPQAAPYILREGKAPLRAPFVRSPDKKAVVYLDRHDRRMVYQDAKGVHHLTGSLPDTAVPTPTFATQNRYVALAKEGAQIFDTKDWTTVSVPGARQVHDLNGSGIVVTTAFQALVLDHRGKTRMSLPLRKTRDAYHLRPDGRYLVVIRGDQERVKTYDTATGKLLAGVALTFPGEDSLEVALGWSKQGPFLVRGWPSERVYYLDLETGKLWKRKK